MADTLRSTDLRHRCRCVVMPLPSDVLPDRCNEMIGPDQAVCDRCEQQHQPHQPHGWFGVLPMGQP